MKGFKWLVLIGSILLIPLLLIGLTKKVNEQKRNIRYDINDYLADEGL